MNETRIRIIEEGRGTVPGEDNQLRVPGSALRIRRKDKVEMSSKNNS